jgi:hypothetical protein
LPPPLCALAGAAGLTGVLLLGVQKGKGKGKGKGKKGKGKKGAGAHSFGNRCDRDEWARNAAQDPFVWRVCVDARACVCGTAVDVDPLSPEFQLIKAKSQIESLEHQLSTDRPASARTALLRLLMRRVCCARSGAHGCRYTRHPGARRGSQSERASEDGAGQVRARRSGRAAAGEGSVLSLCAALLCAVAFSSSKSRTVDISANMTHQYLAMQVRGRFTCRHRSRSKTIELSERSSACPRRRMT